MARAFYRIVTAPTVEELDLDDFKSAKALGAPPPRHAANLPLWDGLSVFATEAQARAKAHDFPGHGAYIARLEIPDDVPMRIERTIKNSRGHHTIWGGPAELLRCVVSVVPV
ncbi:MAG: hypothetical protein ACRDI2_19755 [Chloroflexota bacterium]